MTSASDIIRFLRRLGVLVDDGIVFFAISSSNSLQKSSAIQKISVTLLSVIMICILQFSTSNLLNISDITKRIGNFLRLPIQFFLIQFLSRTRVITTFLSVSRQDRRPERHPPAKTAMGNLISCRSLSPPPLHRMARRRPHSLSLPHPAMALRLFPPHPPVAVSLSMRCMSTARNLMEICRKYLPQA